MWTFPPHFGGRFGWLEVSGAGGGSLGRARPGLSNSVLAVPARPASGSLAGMNARARRGRLRSARAPCARALARLRACSLRSGLAPACRPPLGLSAFPASLSSGPRGWSFVPFPCPWLPPPSSSDIHMREGPRACLSTGSLGSKTPAPTEAGAGDGWILFCPGAQCPRVTSSFRLNSMRVLRSSMGS